MKASRLACASVFASVLGFAAVARAQSSPADRVTAEALFDEAVRMMKAGDVAGACPKLQESQRLDAGVGTLVYLAECYARSGRTASAWATWREASAAARAAGQGDREKMARARADALESELPRVIVKTSGGTATSLEIKRDGVSIAPAILGTAVPVDAGEHTVVASAPGKRSWSKTVQVGKAERVEVVVPPLEDEALAHASTTPPAGGAAPVTEPPQAERSSAGWPTQRWVALGVAGAGVVALGMGTVFGLRASSQWSDVEARCPNAKCTDPSGPSDVDSARTSGNVSTGLFIAGAALLGGGAFLWFTSPHADTRRGGLRVTPAVSRNDGMLTIGGDL